MLQRYDRSFYLGKKKEHDVYWTAKQRERTISSRTFNFPVSSCCVWNRRERVFVFFIVQFKDFTVADSYSISGSNFMVCTSVSFCIRCEFFNYFDFMFLILNEKKLFMIVFFNRLNSPIYHTHKHSYNLQKYWKKKTFFVFPWYWEWSCFKKIGRSNDETIDIACRVTKHDPNVKRGTSG